MSLDAFHDVCEAERERLREVARFYCIVDRPSRNDDISDPETSPQPDEPKRQSKDMALTGLARLGVLQFGCSRAFVSIIDDANQHILAEAAASVSLGGIGSDDTRGGLYVGVKSIDLEKGILPQAIGFFTQQNAPFESTNIVADNARYIVRDLALEDTYKHRSYVASWPFMRYYAAVPIKSPGGHVIGSYCIVDDKPRSGFGDAELKSLQEIADAIAQYIETVRLSYCHHRTETLVKSLTTFVKEQDDFDPAESYDVTPTQPATNLPNPVGSGDASSTERPSLPRAESSETQGNVSENSRGPCSPSEGTGDVSSLFSRPNGSEQTEATFPYRNTDRPGSAWSLLDDRRNSVSQTSRPPTNAPFNDAQPSATEVANKVSRIFRRASVLLRDSMDLDGVLFVDASRCNAGVVLGNDMGTWEPLPATLSPEFLADPSPSPFDIPGVGSLSKTASVPCTVLGRATRDPAKPHRDFNITEKLLDDLMASFPQGQIFDLTNTNVHEWPFQPSSDPSAELCRQLATSFTDAKFVLFSPIWDWNKSRWLAGTLVWTSDTMRALGPEELHYFKAFGDSIISEVARIDWTTTQRSKSAFMSSVSHELRSPLHGILASAELLGGASLPPEEQRLVDMVESCGLTLLDTLNHLLDFSGINNLSALEESTRGSSDAGLASLASEFDLGDLVEEVVEVQYTGQNLPKAALHLNNPISPPPEATDPILNELSVISRVEDASTWRIRSVPGAWRRIIMNLLGNALKWTKAGFVEVSLSKVRRKRDPMHVFAVLSVTDTGAGIAPDFLRHNVFSPFAQENALSQGLGLGLSTVRQLVTSLDGHLNVRSEIDVGTQVDIFIPVEILPSSPTACPPNVNPDKSERPPLSVNLVGFNEYPGLKEPPTGILPAEAKRKLAVQSCLTTVLTEQRNSNISSSQSFDNLECDIAIAEEATLQEVSKQDYLSGREDLRFGGVFVVLNSKIPTDISIHSPRVIRVSQPFGCKKFLDAVTKAEELLRVSPSESYSVLPVRESKSDRYPTDPMASSHEKDNEKLKAAALPSTQLQHTSPPDLEQTPVRHNHHLLIVDDNDINVKLLATFATKINCTYDTASNGLAALNMYKSSSRRYDLILMDISMPVMDGIIATNEIRQFEQDSSLERSRIMAVTGVGSIDMQQRAMAAGVDEYVMKPVSLGALKKAISAL
ncbi:hypothetical protein BDV18DRAFT_109671 [Aspergillus unguis]